VTCRPSFSVPLALYASDMPAETITSLDLFLQDMIVPLQEQFSKRTVLQDELKRNTRRTNFTGLQVRVPLLFAPKQGTAGIAETGTLPVARQLDDRAAYVRMARVTHPIELSEDLIRAVSAKDFVYAGDALKLHMDQAEIAMSRVENEMLLGAGDGLIAAITGVNTGAVVPVGTTANFYQLYVGRIVDILVRSNGGTVSLARQIVAQDRAAGTITLDTTVVTSNLHGVYIEGTYGNAVQGIGQVFGNTGTFQGIDRATTPGWRGVDASPGSASDLSMVILDSATRRVMESAGRSPDFWVGDPAVIDKFGHALIAQFRWQPKITRLQTGWEGIDYRGAPLIPENDAPAGVLYGVNKKAITLYGYGQGPEWDDRTGSKFQRFSRSLPSEAWLVDFLQMGVHQPNALIRVTNLNRAA
jgi:hypothetical protein